MARGWLADACVWNWAFSALSQCRPGVARDLHDRLLAWLTLADERDPVETLVAAVVQTFLR
ncbi:MAG: hypothetical protein ACKOD9_11010 [Rubrivivax sp.]